MRLPGQDAATGHLVIGLRRTPHDRAIIRLALPALGALAADPVVSLVDTAFVGRLGADALGALAVAAAVFGVAFAIFNFLAYGTTPLIARELAEGRRGAAGRLALNAVVVGVGLGVITLAILVAAASPILEAMGASADTIDGARSYLRIRALALPAVMIVTVGHGVFRGFQDTRTPLVVTVGLNIVNLVLDPLFIFGFGWELAGAAWATVIAQYVGASWFVSLLWRRRQEMSIGWSLPAAAELREFVGASRALVLRTSALLGAVTLATAVAARLGTEQVAAHQVAAQIWLFLALVVDALAIAGQAMIGNTATTDRAVAAEISRRLLGLGLMFGVALGVAMAAGFGVVPSWFTDDTEVIRQVEGVYLFVVLMQPLNALVFVWDGVVIGAGDFGYTAWSTVVAAISSAAVLFLVVPLGWGLAGVWWGLVTLIAVRLLAHVRWQVRGPLAS